ncbi:hypothetical protein [Lederbergia galactosidilytica]|uniref:Polymerase nucleotidyl transferase domain-containing protein n=1 Tax=Lederbergia galactosidilytica TaxID=217031 RepID=A0A177ZUK4_9BACI|nr:hypothetical protein [Lederbergia galactosidilytica]OAK70528.1 hypothetical protein ABB05_12280 [Lederbergia galactosidilytica]
MVNVFAVADVIVKHIKHHCPQDIAIVGYYGSYLQGRATERSDLDFFFIPATPRGRKMEVQFIIDGISFDFYPIGWERAERMAALDEWNTTIIADCELLYIRSEEDRARFLKLRENIHAMKESPNAIKLINKAELVLCECFLNLDKFRLAGDSLDLPYCRVLAQEVAGNIFKSLGFLNQIFYTRSWGYYREQVSNLPLKPDKLDKHLDTIMFSHSTNEIMSACEQLIIETLHLILERKNNQKDMRSYKNCMKGYYEEERGMLNKLLTACENGHYETAYFVAIAVQDNLAKILYVAEKGHWPATFDLGKYREIYQQFGYPDLISLLDPTDLQSLKTAVLQLIEMLESHLESEEVPLNIFNSVEEFETFYNRV